MKTKHALLGSLSLLTVPLSTAWAQTFDLTYDAFGVPHVEAADADSAYFGAGYAAGRDRLFQMWRLRLSGQGRLAEFFGADAHPTEKEWRDWTDSCPGGIQGWVGKFEDQDEKHRILGLRHHSMRRAQSMHANHPVQHGYLEQYAAGVNRYIVDALTAQAAPGTTSVDNSFDPAFTQWGITPWASLSQPTDWLNHSERWTAEDCILIWMTVAVGALADPFDDIKKAGLVGSLHSGANPIPLALYPEYLFLETVPNEKATTVRSFDLNNNLQLIVDIANYVQANGIYHQPSAGRDEFFPHFSEWAVARGNLVEDPNGDANSYLWGGPRINSGAPSPTYEWYMGCPEFRVRGAGFAGSPNLLVGSTSSESDEPFNPVSWSVTNGGRDLADLFTITRTKSGETYLLDGAHRGIVKRSETILIKGFNGNPDRSKTIIVESTQYGPIVPRATVESLYDGATIAMNTRIAPPRGWSLVPPRNGVKLPDLSVSAAYMMELGIGNGIQSSTPFLAMDKMYRASGVEEFADAVREHYSYPSVHLGMADGSGDIAYTLAGAVPARAPAPDPSAVPTQAPNERTYAPFLPLDGSDSSNEWQEYLPKNIRPWAKNPARGYFTNANGAGFWSGFDLACYYGGISEVDDRGFELRRFFIDGLSQPGSKIAWQDLVDLSRWRGRRSLEMYKEILEGCVTHSTFNLSAARVLAALDDWIVNANAQLDGSSPGACLAGHANYANCAFDSYYVLKNDPSVPQDRLDAIRWALNGDPTVNPLTSLQATGYGVRNFGVMNFIETVWERIQTSAGSPLQDEEKEIAIWMAEVFESDFARRLGSDCTNPDPVAAYRDEFIHRTSPRAKMPKNWDRFVGGAIPPFPGALESDPIGNEIFPVDPISFLSSTLAGVRGANYNGLAAMIGNDATRRWNSLAIGSSEKDHPALGFFNPRISQIWLQCLGRLKAAPCVPAAPNTGVNSRDVSFP